MTLRRKIRWLTWAGLVACLFAAVPALCLLYLGIQGERTRTLADLARGALSALEELHRTAEAAGLPEAEVRRQAERLVGMLGGGPIRLALFTAGGVPADWPGSAHATIHRERAEPWGWEVAAADLRGDVADTFVAESMAFLLFLATLLVLSWPLSAYLSRAIVQQIEGLSRSMKAVTEGQDEVTVPGLDRRDELGAMARALEYFRGAVRTLVEREKRLSGIMQNVGEAIVVITADGIVEEVNPAAVRLFGADPAGRPFVDLFVEPDRRRTLGLLAAVVGAVTGEATARADALGVDHRGERLDVSLVLSRLTVGERLGMIAVLADVTERLRHERELMTLATRDRLTGLPNRALVESLVDQAIARRSADGPELAVLCLDLSRFKLVTDTLGHRAGDQLLLEVAHRLQELLPADAILGRIGSDDFAVVLSEPGDAGNAATMAATMADGIVAAFDRPVHLLGNEHYARPSIGIALFPAHGGTAAELLRSADTALYAAKRQGSWPTAFFHPEMGDRARRHLALDRELRQALAGGQFRVHYQPKVSLLDFTLEGFEALLRWEKPGHGLVAPGEFIPVAEDSGFIVPLGDWVLDEVCRQQRAWLDRGADPVPVAVNISPRHLRQRTAESFGQILARHGVPPDLIELEITESAVMQDIDHALAVLRGLKALGVRVALDDFGTGHSSLSHLKRLPVSTLKIDRSFIDGIPQTREDAGIVSTIIDMAEMLGLSVVAEGVERPEQAHFLRRHNCLLVQGWLTGRPAPAEAVAPLLLQRLRERA